MRRILVTNKYSEDVLKIVRDHVRGDFELLPQSEYEYFFQSLHCFSSFPAPAMARILPNPIRFPLYMISEL